MLLRVRCPWASFSLIATFLCATASAQYNSRGPESRIQPPIIPADAKDIVLKGEQVCLKRIPDANGRVMLDCAIGLRGDDDKFYGLRAADPNRSSIFSDTNVRVRVTGKLVVRGSGEFEESGQIIYTAIESIDGDPKPVTGTFMCLGARGITNCRNVIKTDRGLYWGLENLSQQLAPGDRVELAGDIVRSVPQQWHPWMWDSGGESIQGVLKVRTLKKLPAR